MFKMAVIQMQSSNRLEANLEKMEAWVREASENKADAIAFPEMAYFTGPPEECREIIAKCPSLLERWAGWAKKYKILLIPGSLREPSPRGKNKYFNLLPVFSPAGQLMAQYRKIFLFKANLPDREYDEPKYCDPGDQLVHFQWNDIRFGLSVCFDLRFPEFFRALKKRGAQVVLLPSAFTVPTGKQHWKPLIVSRAIENQFFMIAPAQVGRSGSGSEKYGHSLAVSPWGKTLLDMETKEGLAVCEISLSVIEEHRKKLDAWACRREELFPIA